MSADAREARRAIDGRPRSGADDMSGGPTPGAWWPHREAANIPAPWPDARAAATFDADQKLTHLL